MKYYKQNIFFIAIINICLIYPQSANEIKSELNKAGLSIDDAKKIAKESGILDGPINEQTLQKGNDQTEKIDKNKLIINLDNKQNLEKSITDLDIEKVEDKLTLDIEDKLEETEDKQSESIDPTIISSGYFGYNIFYNDPEIFQNSFSESIDPNYIVGPGDEIVIMLWGDTELNNSFIVSQEGYLFINNVGQVFVNGLDMASLEKKLFRLLKKVYSSLDPKSGNATTFFDASLGASVLRPLRVFCLGEIDKPGAYSVKNSATLFTSLYYFNGPSINGSLRNIKLLRGQNELANIDFYEFLLYGKKTDDVQIIRDDIIFVPRRGKTVTVSGEINRPFIFELKEDEGLMELIDFAGGLKSTTDMDIVQIERIIPHDKRSNESVDRTLIDINLNDLYKKNENFSLVNNDKLFFFKISETITNQVTINGQVNRPGIYALDESMNLSDIVMKADGITGDAYLEKADIIRSSSDLSQEHIDINLGLALKKDINNDIKLKSGDVIEIYSNISMKYRTDVSIGGHVLSPGTKPFREGMKIYDLVFLGGGFENNQHLKNTYFDRADLMRFSEDDYSQQIMSFRLDSVLAGKGKANFNLKMGDQITIYSKEEVYGGSVKTINISGKIKNPGNYPLYDNYKLSDYLFLAGGFNDKNFIKDIYFDRADIIRISNNFLSKNIISINLNNIINNPSSVDNIKLKNGDNIRFYSQNDFSKDKIVTLEGIVSNPGQYELKNEMTLKDLIFEAGGLTQNNYQYLVELSRINSDLISEDYYSEILTLKLNNKYELTDYNDESYIINNNVFLKPYDYVIIRSNPFFTKQYIVSIQGLVYYPGNYALTSPNEKVSDLIKRAGGFRPEAYPIASTFTRRGEQINLSFDKLLKNPFSKYNFVLEEGDAITIGSKSNMVFIEGSVNTPGSYQYLKGSRLKDYIELAGGYTEKASKYSSYVKYPNGVSQKVKFYKISPKILDGSTIYIGTKEEVEAFNVTEYVTDITTIWADLTQAYLMILLLVSNQGSS